MTETTVPPRFEGGLYVKRPIPVRCDQWWRNGDHPEDRVGVREVDMVALLDAHPEFIETGPPTPLPEDAPTYERMEGAVVRFFCHPDVYGESFCQHCGRVMRWHGWIDTLEGGHVVCPGDVIITGVRGERYPCKPDIFAETYEAARA